MTVLDPFPIDQNRIIKDLEQRIKALEDLVRTVAGAPVTRASGAFIIPSSSRPDPGSGEVGIWSSSGEAMWTDENGEDHSLGMDLGSPVDNPASQTATPLGSSTPVLGSHYNLMGQDIDKIWIALVALLDRARGRIIEP